MKRSLAPLAVAAALGASAAARAQDPAAAPPAESPPASAPQPTDTPPPQAPPAQAEPAPARPQGGSVGSALPYGLVFSADLGGGGRLGGGSQYTARGIFEAELSAGYELAAGFRPELSVLLGVAPKTYAGLRLGLHYALPDMPFYVRGALDGSTERGTARWRWLLAGGGGEVRLTDVLGAFAEADLGIPLSSGSGVPVLVRAGVTFRM